MSDCEEKLAREKAAVDSMRNAKANMDQALDRIATLERALSALADRMARTKDYVGRSAYIYGGHKTAHAEIDEAITAARAAL